jgi:hypothetical protein
MAIRYYVKAATSEYTDKEGKSKKKYQSIGVVIETKNGLMLKLETIPLLAMKEGSLMAYLNDMEEAKPNTEFPKTLADIPDDVPF